MKILEGMGRLIRKMSSKDFLLELKYGWLPLREAVLLRKEAQDAGS